MLGLISMIICELLVNIRLMKEPLIVDTGSLSYVSMVPNKEHKPIKRYMQHIDRSSYNDTIRVSWVSTILKKEHMPRNIYRTY